MTYTPTFTWHMDMPHLHDLHLLKGAAAQHACIYLGGATAKHVENK